MVDDAQRIIYLVYKATVHQFLSRIALEQVKVGNKKPAEVTLKDVLDTDPKLKEMFEKSFGFVSVTASLADAKGEMERVGQKIPCNDVFVTQNGKSEEPILGWVSDNTIAENLKV